MKRKIIQALLISSILFLAAVVSACSTSSNTGQDNSSSNSTTDASSSSSSPKESSSNIEKIEFSFGHFGSSDNPQHVGAIEPFAKEVEAKTDGNVKFEIYPGAALAPPPETYNSVINGVMDAGWGIHGYNPGKWPLHTVINLPFVAKGSAAQISVVAEKLYQQFPEIQSEYDDVKRLWFFGTDEYVILTKSKPVRSYDDVKGLKLRSPNPEAAKMIEQWGATPVSMPVTDLYDALQKGVVDGTVSSINTLEDFQLYDVVKFATHGSFTNNLMYAVMNKERFNEIYPEGQQVFDELIGEKWAKVAGEAFDNQLEQTMKKSSEAGIEFITLPEEDLQKFKNAATDVNKNWIAEQEGKGFPAQEIYDAAVELMNANE